MSTQASTLRELFLHNRAINDGVAYSRLLALERAWILPILEDLESGSARPESREEFLGLFNQLLEQERSAPAASAGFLARHATREQFRVVVQEFAVDGLTEAQSFFPILARLPLRAQMALMRVFIDEFGCGRLEQSHTQLYRALLEELGLPLDIPPYLPRLNAESLAFVNVFYWLSQRAPWVEYFLGALAYLESSVPYAFACHAEACERLGIQSRHYYTEHMHIDAFHARELQVAIREVEVAQGVDFTRVWVGARLASMLIGQAFDAAVAKARRGGGGDVISS